MSRSLIRIREVFRCRLFSARLRLRPLRLLQPRFAQDWREDKREEEGRGCLRVLSLSVEEGGGWMSGGMEERDAEDSLRLEARWEGGMRDWRLGFSIARGQTQER